MVASKVGFLIRCFGLDTVRTAFNSLQSLDLGLVDSFIGGVWQDSLFLSNV